MIRTDETGTSMDILGLLIRSQFRSDTLPMPSRQGGGELPYPAGMRGAAICDYLRASFDLYTELMLVRHSPPVADPAG